MLPNKYFQQQTQIFGINVPLQASFRRASGWLQECMGKLSSKAELTGLCLAPVRHVLINIDAAEVV